MLAYQGRRSRRAIADGPEPHPPHPIGERRAKDHVPRARPDGFGHDVDQHETGQRAVGDAQDGHRLFAVDAPQNGARGDGESVLPVLPDG